MYKSVMSFTDIFEKKQRQPDFAQWLKCQVFHLLIDCQSCLLFSCAQNVSLISQYLLFH